MIEKLPHMFEVHGLDDKINEVIKAVNAMEKRIIALEPSLSNIAPDPTPAKPEPKQCMVACSARNICEDKTCPVKGPHPFVLGACALKSNLRLCNGKVVWCEPVSPEPEPEPKPEPKSTDQHANLCLRLESVFDQLRADGHNPGAATVEEAIAELRKGK
jgi:hypothetical protein